MLAHRRRAVTSFDGPEPASTSRRGRRGIARLVCRRAVDANCTRGSWSLANAEFASAQQHPLRCPAV